MMAEEAAPLCGARHVLPGGAVKCRRLLGHAGEHRAHVRLGSSATWR